MEWMANPEIWIALATLTALEIVLGIDNVVFISILAGKLPAEQQAACAPHRPRARDAHAHRSAALAWPGSSGSPRRSSPWSARRSPAAI